MSLPSKLRSGCLALAGILAGGLLALAVLNWRVAARRARPLEEPQLTPAEKTQLSEALRLKTALGDRVWPGFGRAEIPVILFNDRYEFLVHVTGPPAPWKTVEGGQFQGKPYYRRAARNPQAFAVPVGAGWAGSLGTLERMNREYLLGARQQLPPVIAQLFPYFFATITADFHVAALLHELFHAHQALSAPAHFAATRPFDKPQPRYPYQDETFAAAWDREGALLTAALDAADQRAARPLVRQFLEARQARRSRAALSDHLRAYERHMEWLEGLAKHVEIRSYELWGYRSDFLYWKMDFQRLKSRLGRQSGDQRFYLSGMAQARLLDKLVPKWQLQAMRGQVCLEDLLRDKL